MKDSGVQVTKLQIRIVMKKYINLNIRWYFSWIQSIYLHIFSWSTDTLREDPWSSVGSAQAAVDCPG